MMLTRVRMVIMIGNGDDDGCWVMDDGCCIMISMGDGVY